MSVPKGHYENAEWKNWLSDFLTPPLLHFPTSRSPEVSKFRNSSVQKFRSLEVPNFWFFYKTFFITKILKVLKSDFLDSSDFPCLQLFMKKSVLPKNQAIGTSGLLDFRKWGSGDRKLGKSDSRKVGKSESRKVGKSESRKVGKSESRKVGKSGSRKVGKSESQFFHSAFS
jgi:hypothetical protein